VMLAAQWAVISPVETVLPQLGNPILFDLLSLSVLSSFGVGSYLLSIRLLSPQIFRDFLRIGRLLRSKTAHQKPA